MSPSNEPAQAENEVARDSVELAADLLREREKLIKEFCLMLSDIDKRLDATLGDGSARRLVRHNSEPLPLCVLRAMYASTKKSMRDGKKPISNPSSPKHLATPPRSAARIV